VITIKKFVLTVIFIVMMCGQAFGGNKIPWHQRNFDNVPRISAEKARKFLLAGVKMIIVDVPWTKGGYDHSHVCGAIMTSTHADKIDRLLRKIPKNYIIMAYCK